jgi:hypothetical protein
MSGTKTHEHQVRQFEQGGDSQNRVEDDGSAKSAARIGDERQTGNPSSVAKATNRESRDHNKHNDPGQSGHKPQKHTPEGEKR